MLKTQAKMPIEITTTLGKLTYSRYSLIPKDAASRDKLRELRKVNSIYPLDSYMGIAGLPFKMTPAAMLEVAYWAQNQSSYQRAEDAIFKIMRVKINDDTVRLVSNFVGSLVFENDCMKATEAMALLDSGKLDCPKNKSGVLYILADGAALNTRTKNEEGSSWRENKLGEVFSTDNIHCWTDHKNKKQHKILKREYTSYVGSADEFKKHLFSMALRNGYGKYKQTVVISDGATWIRNMVGELFPDAQQILDYYHLCENVNTFAKTLFKDDELKYKPWAQHICDSLKAGNYKAVLMELETLEKKPHGSNFSLFGYITNNIHNIDYPKYAKNDFFIGSGAIESANKTVLQDRLKRAGMRWNTKTAQPLLSLKAKAESSLWLSDVVLPFCEYCMRQSLLL